MRYGHLIESGPWSMENVGVGFVQTEVNIHNNMTAMKLTLSMMSLSLVNE